MIQQLQPHTAAFLGFNQINRPENKRYADLHQRHQDEIRKACLDYLQTLPKKKQTGKTIIDYADLELGVDVLKATADAWANQINPESRPKAKKLSDEDLENICKMLLQGNKVKNVAKFFGITDSRITQIKNGTYRPDITRPLIGDYYHVKGAFEVKK